ncbi:hypothetical protein [Rhizobium sp. L1K21]|uniref:hypothetical protein n=1 Tax=Rhizobium sp. L1K21 TaxID=2954933 RepID=UPI00209369B2|nr:hypothetical protein [Rhizobium sp. L1K21]MCO6186288.1 hypothetical protein [Rhizobium sp. L1K21]
MTLVVSLVAAEVQPALAALPRPLPAAADHSAFGTLLIPTQAAPGAGGNNGGGNTGGGNTGSGDTGGGAGVGTGDTPAGGSDTPSDSGSRPGHVDLSWLMTGKIAKDFDATVDECGRYDEVYRIDCLRRNIELIAKSLPRGSDYREARQILLKASSALDRIVRQNADTRAPTLEKKPNANRRFKKAQRYRAVRRDRLANAMSQARAVIEEARTELLRSAENSQARLAHYQTIATAVGSTKVLLRSS